MLVSVATLNFIEPAQSSRGLFQSVTDSVEYVTGWFAPRQVPAALDLSGFTPEQQEIIRSYAFDQRRGQVFTQDHVPVLKSLLTAMHMYAQEDLIRDASWCSLESLTYIASSRFPVSLKREFMREPERFTPERRSAFWVFIQDVPSAGEGDLRAAWSYSPQKMHKVLSMGFSPKARAQALFHLDDINDTFLSHVRILQEGASPQEAQDIFDAAPGCTLEHLQRVHDLDLEKDLCVGALKFFSINRIFYPAEDLACVVSVKHLWEGIKDMENKDPYRFVIWARKFAPHYRDALGFLSPGDFRKLWSSLEYDDGTKMSILF